MFDSFGRMLVIVGVMLVILGLGLIVGGRLGFWQRLPGNIVFEYGGVSCVFPILGSLVLSVLLTVILNLIVRLLGR